MIPIKNKDIYCSTATRCSNSCRCRQGCRRPVAGRHGDSDEFEHPPATSCVTAAELFETIQKARRQPWRHGQERDDFWSFWMVSLTVCSNSNFDLSPLLSSSLSPLLPLLPTSLKKANDSLQLIKCQVGLNNSSKKQKT
ncbi:hypothetical protein L596_006200 [Steinernema carpocapsae]|uniref:Uncharacterized protein n=1 Tax=Steinernema carpocapsae TaxID=34508 RepID=A0A4U8V759_STECR|nr:hypothetical protein L596_006200 [Steinernema carpocapsae]